MRPVSMRPLVAVTALVPCLLLLNLPSHAQNSGPVNSGGGWVAQKNPNVTPYSYDNAYAWTPFTVTSSTVNHAGVTSNYSTSVYGNYIRSGEPVGGGADQKESHSVSGTATYEWLWTPTGSNLGAPAPPLYVLTKATGFGNLASGNGLFGDATMNFTSSVSVFTLGGQPVPVSQYKIVATAGSAPAKASMSPTFSSDLIGTPTGDSGVGNVSLTTVAYPIVITTPNPMSRPDLGDGKNQFVYDNIVPGVAPNDKGHLFVDGIVQVPGAVNADLAWLLVPTPKIDCTFDGAMTASTAIGLPASHTWALNGSSLQVQTSSATDSRVATTHNQFVFFGLPTNNDGFGNHQETLTVQTTDASGNTANSTAGVANIQTFFLSTASNYPGAYTDYQNFVPTSANPSTHYWTPNWYHYYNQVYTATGPYTPITTSRSSSYCDPFSSLHPIYIKDDAFASGSMRVFTVDTSDPNSTVKYAGALAISGIFQYIAVCAHEKGHQDAWKSQPPPYTQIYTASTSNDADRDGIDDSWEANHHFGSSTNDTTGAYYGMNMGGDIADQEVIADIPALGDIFTYKKHWSCDWAGAGVLLNGARSLGGVQSGIPALAISPTAGVSDYYFLFYPVTGGSKSTGWTYASTGVRVWSISDIQSAVSPSIGGTVLTSLP